VLPPELTRARKREGKLSLSALSPAERARATEVAELLIGVTRAALGEPREDVQASWAALPVAAKERKLLAGLTHLLEGHAEFTAPTSAEPEAVRRAVFERAARRRAELPPGEHLQRSAVLAEIAEEMGLPAEQLEQALFADLRSAQRLERCGLTNAAALVSEYELVQVQSVLLRAERIEAEVRAAKPDAYRELFRKLKFRQLLHRIEPLEPSGYRLEIDGPMSLFGATTKYGLELALSLPALLSCGSLRLKADLRWGKRRERLRFEQVYDQAPVQDADAGIRTEVLDLLEALGAAKSELEARLSEELIDLTERGGGVLVPDLELRRRGAAANEPKVLVELLGFWSREAVFRRIEAAERGLSHPVLFVVSSRLRVSEELLDGVEAASLYVYKGKVNAHALLRKVEGLLAEQAARDGHPGEAPAGRATRLRSKTARRPE
jgi:predicted nuclease of restriction endonuclease-like RecB superfamily